MKFETVLKQTPNRFTKYLHGSLFVNAYALILSNILVAVASYVFWIIVARKYGPGITGTASGILSAMAVLNTITSFGLEVGLLRYIPSLPNPHHKASLITFSSAVRTAASVFAAVVFLAGIRVWSPGLIDNLNEGPEIWLFIFLVLTNGIYQLFNAVFVAHRTSQFVTLTSAVYNGLKLLFLLLIPVIFGFKGVIFTVVASIFITILYAGYRIQQTYRGYDFRFLQSGLIKEFLIYSSSNQLVDVFLGLPQMLLPLFVINSLGAEANGIFYIAWMISSIVRTFSVSIAQSTFAESSSQAENFGKNLWQGLKLSILVTVSCAALLAVFAPWLLSFFGKSYVSGGLVILQWFLVSVIPFSFVILYITAQRVRKNIPYLLLVTGAWFGVSVIASLIGLKANGLEGLTTGWVLSQFISLALCVVLFFIENFLLTKRIKLFKWK